MGGYGCFVTSSSMVASYYGSSKNPGEICTWLNANGGFQTGTGYLYPSKIPAAAGGSISWAGSIAYPRVPADMAKINAELAAGYPVIAAVNGYGHYIVITGHDGDTYYINDPGGPTLAARSGTFNQWYGSPVANYIDAIYLFHGAHGTPPPARSNPIAPGDAGFTKGGTAAGWTSFYSGVYGTSIYTYVSPSARDNWGRWTFDLSKLNGTGDYKIEAFITSTNAGTQNAVYHINTASGTRDKSINQRATSGWQDLGTYRMSAGSAWVELDDVTGETNYGNEISRIAFDAIRFTYMGDATAPGVPSGVAASATGANSVQVSWNASSDPSGIKHYLLYMNGALKATVTGTSATVPDLAPITAYNFFVKAVDNAGNTSGASTTVSATTLRPPSVYVSIEGVNRYTTAVAASVKAFTSSEYVVIATGGNWPDALGGSALAGALNAPILLTGQDALPSEVRAEIVRLGATKVIVLGGAGAVSDTVYNQIDQISNVSVERIAGLNRYDTANLTAARTIQVQGGSYGGTAFVATGADFPDAVGASPLAAAKGWPIYLANPNLGNNASLVSVMKTAGVTDAILLGGTSVVADSVRLALGATYETRLAGATRYDTAAQVAAYGVSNAGLHWNKVALTTGANFPDALAGGVLQGENGSVLLLTPTATLHDAAAAALRTNQASIFEARFLGGTGAVSQAVRTSVATILQ